MDEDELYAALSAGKLKGAALDVFLHEPPTDVARWAGLDNVLLSSHVAGSTNESREAMVNCCLEDLSLRLAGERPRHIVNEVARS